MRHYLKLLRYAKPYRSLLLLIFGLTMVASLLAAAQPWPMKFLADYVLGSTATPDYFNETLKSLSLSSSPSLLLSAIAIANLVLFGLNSVVEIGLTWTWTVAGRRMVNDLALDLFAALQRRSLLFHTRSRVGDLLSRVTGDNWCLHEIIDILFSPGHALMILCTMIFLMFRLDAALTGLLLLLAPLMVASSFFFGKQIRAAAKNKREIECNIQSHLQETLTGIPVVQTFVQEEREQSRFRRAADSAIHAEQHATILSHLNGFFSGMVSTIGTGIVLLVGATHVIDGRLTIGSLLVFIVYLSSLQTQIKTLAKIYPSLETVRIGVNRVFEILASAPEIQSPANPKRLTRVDGFIRFENVTFGYEPSSPVFKNINLEVKPGETLAIVGSTGAGKSTIAGLIPRFMDPWEGRVALDGTDIRQLELKSLRAQISIVLQESFLFPVSVAENIAYGNPHASQKQIEAAARQANAHLFIDQLPAGYSTIIGERGATLSGGERQRLAIARAILKNAPILILDEPTSAVDSLTEFLILEALERLTHDRTVIVIAHRLSTIQQADRIVVLRDGQIQESGTHRELLQQRGIYANLHGLQLRSLDTAIAAAG